MGVLAPDIEVLDIGLGMPSARDDGRAYEVTLARELGRLVSDSGPPRLGNGPKDKRLTPDVLSLGTWLPLEMVEGGLRGVSSPAMEDAEEPVVRLRERIVTVEGMLIPPCTEDRGDARGGVRDGAGSLDRAECTRASRRCI